MNVARIARLACALALVVAAAGGCAKRESAEARQQREEMTQEHQTWRAEMQNWDNAHSQLRSVLTAPPSSGARTDTTGISDTMAKLKKHEEDVAQFRQSLDEMDQKIQDYKEHEPALLWAEHMKLKAQYEMLENAHEGIARDVASATGDTTAARTY